MKFSARLLRRSTSFWVTIGLFLSANIWSFFAHPECCDQYDRIGFPLPFHLSGGIAGIAEFYPIGLTLNVLIALTIAVIAARIGLLVRPRD